MLNQTLKTELFKLIGETSLTWVKVLLLALSMRGRSHTVTGLSPHEVLTGHPTRMTNTPFLKNRVSLQGMEEDMVEICVTLNSVFKRLFPRVKVSLPNLAGGAEHYFNPGDFVVVKDFRRESWKDLYWRVPYQALLTTSTVET
jgi:hypothetical protein